MLIRRITDPFTKRMTEILQAQHADNAGLIEYVAMMTDVELPTDEAEEGMRDGGEE